MGYFQSGLILGQYGKKFLKAVDELLRRLVEFM